MNTKLKNKHLGIDDHPDESQLLLALERELPPEEAAAVDRHLRACQDCRAKSVDLERGIAAFAEYREKRYLPSLDSAPHDFPDFRGRLRAAANEVDGESAFANLRGLLFGRGHSPAPLRWAALTAALMVAVILWTQVLSPTQLSASELLMRARTFQNPQAPRGAGSAARKAHQKVRISSSRGPAVVRDFEWSVGGEGPSRWESQGDPSLWNVPMTADAFANWRDSLPARKDDVTRSGELWTLETTTAGNTIREARLVVRADDFHPVEQHIVFADSQRLDFEELSFEIRAQETTQRADVPQQIAQNSMPSLAATRPEQPIDLRETELAVHYLLFSNQWDLDEDLQVTRGAAEVVVEGTASSADLAPSMQASLSAVPNVRAAIVAPGARQQSDAAAAGPANTVSAAATPLLKNILERSFALSNERQAFVDRSLDASDAALSHAWVLKKLAERYSEEEEAALSAESRVKLKQILQSHLQQLRSSHSVLDQLVELLPPSAVREPGPTVSWRTAIGSLFSAVQQQDSLVAALIVGARGRAPDSGQDLRSASQSLRTANRTIRALLGRLEGGTNAIQ